MLVFQKGVGNGLLGFQQADRIEAWVPLFLFSVLFGLSMDYQVFLLSRIKERYTQTGDTAAAVSFGVGSTARLITGAALIIIAVFGGFAAGDLVMFQQMGFGVAVALLVDATIVRSVLVPASMKLLGERNWYLPSTPRLHIWAWPLAALVGFPIGGEIANVVVGPVDSVGPALAGGLIAGAVIGAAQWLALRRLVPWVWIAVTSVGMAVGLAVGAALVDYGISRGHLVVMGAVTGALVGGLQALVLARERISGAAWWAMANPPAWALGWLVTSYVITKNVDERFTNFGASGTLLFALLTSLLLALLFRRRESGPTA